MKSLMKKAYINKQQERKNQELKNIVNHTIRWMNTIYLITLNNEFGFGEKRLKKVIQNTARYSDIFEADNDYLMEIVNQFREQYHIGI